MWYHMPEPSWFVIIDSFNRVQQIYWLKGTLSEDINVTCKCETLSRLRRRCGLLSSKSTLWTNVVWSISIFSAWNCVMWLIWMLIRSVERRRSLLMFVNGLHPKGSFLVLLIANSFALQATFTFSFTQRLISTHRWHFEFSIFFKDTLTCRLKELRQNFQLDLSFWVDHCMLTVPAWLTSSKTGPQKERQALPSIIYQNNTQQQSNRAHNHCHWNM